MSAQAGIIERDADRALGAVLDKGPSAAALERLLGEAPGRVVLRRSHFSTRRPVQFIYEVGLRGGAVAEVIAEHCPTHAEEHALSQQASLAKSRNGQRAGLAGGGIVCDAGRGLVLRRPGLDDRLPGLRLLYDAEAARAALAACLGTDPGPTEVRLVAHRLGKRAVLRLCSRDGEMRFARLHTIKSGSGRAAYARHLWLWRRLSETPALAIPRPLGNLPKLGLSLYERLPGAQPAFLGPDGLRTCRDVGRALTALQGMELGDLPRHGVPQEAEVLRGWAVRLSAVRPRLAEELNPAIERTLTRLAEGEAAARPCHRDLHEKQIHISDTGVGLLDLDTLCLADPALDVGNLQAHLFLQALEMGESSAPSEQSLARAARRTDAPRIRPWRQAALLRLCLIYAFTHMDASLHAALRQEACA